jgi:hypothetical protein
MHDAEQPDTLLECQRYVVEQYEMFVGQPSTVLAQVKVWSDGGVGVKIGCTYSHLKNMDAAKAFLFHAFFKKVL